MGGGDGQPGRSLHKLLNHAVHKIDPNNVKNILKKAPHCLLHHPDTIVKDAATTTTTMGFAS